jgi:hypothetical protein
MKTRGESHINNHVPSFPASVKQKGMTTEQLTAMLPYRVAEELKNK